VVLVGGVETGTEVATGVFVTAAVAVSALSWSPLRVMARIATTHDTPSTTATSPTSNRRRPIDTKNGATSDGDSGDSSGGGMLGGGNTENRTAPPRTGFGKAEYGTAASGTGSGNTESSTDLTHTGSGHTENATFDAG
jgi:hypothetical protein